MKYKVGDRVKIVKDRPEFFNQTWKMDNFLWTEMTIKEVWSNIYTMEGEMDWAFDNSCIEGLVEEIYIPWERVWVSDHSQELADEWLQNNYITYYIWKNKNGRYITEYEDWAIVRWKFISKKSKPKAKEMTMKEICKELGREIKIVKS